MDHMSIKAGTIALWAKPEYADADRLRVIFYHTTQPAWDHAIHLFTDIGSNGLILGMGDNHWLRRDIIPLLPGNWYHMAVTWEENSGTPGRGIYHVYVNGESRATGTYSGLTRMGQFADIGNDANPNSRKYAFDGLIHDVQMYNYPLNADEIQSLVSPDADTCDVNGDGDVDVRDMQSCVNHILEIQDWGASADVNEDGEVNVLDIQAIIVCVLDN
jgi:hypothetical protein